MSERFYWNEPDLKISPRYVNQNCTGRGTTFAIPVVYHSQLMSAKQAGLDGHIIKPKNLQDIAGKMTRQPLLQLA